VSFLSSLAFSSATPGNLTAKSMLVTSTVLASWSTRVSALIAEDAEMLFFRVLVSQGKRHSENRFSSYPSTHQSVADTSRCCCRPSGMCEAIRTVDPASAVDSVWPVKDVSSACDWAFEKGMQSIADKSRAHEISGFHFIRNLLEIIMQSALFGIISEMYQVSIFSLRSGFFRFVPRQIYLEMLCPSPGHY